MKRNIALLIILAMILILALGCNSESATSDADTDTDANKAEIGWTATPSIDVIPDGDISGEANGVEFKAQAVYFEPSFGKWSLKIADEELSSPIGIISSGQRINIDLNEIPESGKVYIKEMEYGGSYFQINKKDNPEETTSWNTDNAYAIEITKWEINEYDPEGSLFQEAGKASGKVFVVYSGESWDDFDNSWAAGTFTDVPIRYMGAPDLEY